MKKLFIYLSIALSISIVSVFVYSCAKEEPVAVDISNTPIPDGMMRIQLNGLESAITTTTLKSGQTVPDDQDTIYVYLSKTIYNSRPDYIIKIAPILDTYVFDVEYSMGGYDVLILTYPLEQTNYIISTDWSLPKHIWRYVEYDVGANVNTSSGPIKLDIELERLSSNVIFKSKNDMPVPDNISSINISLDLVFKQFEPYQWKSYKGQSGHYARLRTQLWPTDDNIFYHHRKTMGMYETFYSGIERRDSGTFYIELRYTDHTYQYINYKDKLVVQSGKTTILEFDFDALNSASSGGTIVWVNNEDNVIVPIN